jgi:hypothetical protein
MSNRLTTAPASGDEEGNRRVRLATALFAV